MTTPLEGAVSATADRQRELLDAVRRDLVGAAPAGWIRIDVKAYAVVRITHLTISVLTSHGTTVAVSPPLSTSESVRQLRELMYVEGHGTWFSMRLMVDEKYGSTVVYNTDHDPSWWPSIDASEWVRDLESFPRDPEHVPDWLRAQLLEAGVAAEALPSRAVPPHGNLGAEEQQRLLMELTDRIVHEMPMAWDHCQVNVFAYGDLHAASALVQSAIPGGGVTAVALPDDVVDRFLRLRAGMYRPGRGTWLLARLRVAYPDLYSIEYVQDAPWERMDRPGPPDPAECARELERFPRQEQHVPSWLRP